MVRRASSRRCCGSMSPKPGLESGMSHAERRIRKRASEPSATLVACVPHHLVDHHTAVVLAGAAFGNPHDVEVGARSGLGAVLAPHERTERTQACAQREHRLRPLGGLCHERHELAQHPAHAIPARWQRLWRGNRLGSGLCKEGIAGGQREHRLVGRSRS